MLGHKLDCLVFPYKYMLRAYLVYQTFEKEVIPIIYNIIQRIEAECILHNSFYEVSLSILMSKLKKKKKITRNYKSTSYMNTDAKILNKISVNIIQQCKKYYAGALGWDEMDDRG